MAIHVAGPMRFLASVQKRISDALPGTMARRYLRSASATPDAIDKNKAVAPKNEQTPTLAQGLAAPQQGAARPTPRATPGMLLPGQSLRDVEITLRDVVPEDVYWGYGVQETELQELVRGCKTLKIAGCNVLVDGDARLIRGAGADGVDRLILGGRDGKPELVLPLRLVSDPRWGDGQGRQAVALELKTSGKELMGSLPADEVTETANWRLPVSALFQIGYATPQEHGSALVQLKESAIDERPYVPEDFDPGQYYLTNWHPAGADYVPLLAARSVSPVD